jgi:signal peptidase
MRPAFAPGDMVFVTPEPVRDVRVGQVISYRIPIADHHVQSHRVIAVVRRGGHVSVRTKGDANTTRDPWTAQLNGPTAWRVRLVVPKIGLLIFWLRLPLVHELTVLLAPVLLAILAAVRIWRKDDSAEDADAAGAAAV